MEASGASEFLIGIVNRCEEQWLKHALYLSYLKDPAMPHIDVECLNEAVEIVRFHVRELRCFMEGTNSEVEALGKKIMDWLQQRAKSDDEPYRGITYRIIKGCIMRHCPTQIAVEGKMVGRAELFDLAVDYLESNNAPILVSRDGKKCVMKLLRKNT